MASENVSAETEGGLAGACAPEGSGDRMLAEIREQPEAIARCLDENHETAKALAEEIRKRDIRYAVIAARGTSDHAAVYAKYMLEIEAGIPVALAAPSVWTLYGGKMDLRNTLVIGVSQSGAGPDIVEVIERAREQGALTIGVTNFDDSALADAADDVLLLHAGIEQSVAATKTYTTSLAALGLLAARLGKSERYENALREAPGQINQVLGIADEVRQVSERYRYMEDCMVVARGINQCTAQEAALKLAETNYLVTHAYSGADFQHGPIAVVDQGFPCILFNPEGKAHDLILELSAKLKERGAERLMVAHDEASVSASEYAIRIPVAVAEETSPLVYIVAGQMFAYCLARHKGYDPDKPRGLNKVTKTR